MREKQQFSEHSEKNTGFGLSKYPWKLNQAFTPGTLSRRKCNKSEHIVPQGA